jgi:TonB family protein
MSSSHRTNQRADDVPHFVLVSEQVNTPKHLASVAGISGFVHLLLALGLVWVLNLPAPPRRAFQPIPIANAPRRVFTPLVAPPSELTQKAPNEKPLSKEINLASIRPRPAQASQASPGAASLPRRATTQPKFVPPSQQAPQSNTPAPVTMRDAGAVELGQIRNTTAPPPVLGVPEAPPPPRIQPEEKPKLAFEKPGATTGQQAGLSRLPSNRTTLEETVRQVARGGGLQGIIVGDVDESTGSSPTAPTTALPGKLGSSVELLSDPQGVDFRPYLEQVLSAVRRNWFAVIPESARLGRAGRVFIQFAIGRDGRVAKLVISAPSGAEALDRAGVAGISASNPFPPLPEGFKGSQVRLQLAFKYNVR